MATLSVFLGRAAGLVAGMLAGVAVAATKTPSEHPAPLDSSNLISSVFALLVVLALILGLAWLMRRFMQTPGLGKGHIQIIGGVSLGARERAVLLSVDGTRLLVGVAPGRVQTLHVLGPEPPVLGAESFAGQLAQAQGDDA